MSHDYSQTFQAEIRIDPSAGLGNEMRTGSTLFVGSTNAELELSAPPLPLASATAATVPDDLVRFAVGAFAMVVSLSSESELALRFALREDIMSRRVDELSRGLVWRVRNNGRKFKMA